MAHIAVLTSGGDSPGMNAAVTAIARSAALLDMPLLGVDRGFNGLLGKHPETDFMELPLEKALDIADLPGTQLRTARCVEFLDPEVQKRAAQILRERDIRGLIVIGGNGSFQGAQALCNNGIPCIGIPGTIDNDLAYTEMTLGFDTAVNVCVDTVRAIRATSRSHDRPHVVEVMGRHCGDIALMTAASTGAEIVIAPEANEWSVEEVAHRLKSQIARGNYRSTVIVAEGSWEKMHPFDLEKFLTPYGITVYRDAQGNQEPMSAFRFAQVLECMCGIKVRHTVPGYTQRGMQPTARDAAFAFEAGVMAVRMLSHGQSNRVIGMRLGKVFDEDIQTALSAKRPFNRSLYNTINGL